MNSLPEIGDIVDDTYEIMGVLGKGGFGAVYRARQLSMERDVALKLLTASGPKFGEMVKRFRREVMAIRNLTHPNTVQIYDFHDDPDGLLYYTMEALEGQTLKEEVRNQGPLPPSRLRHILVQVLKSLSEAHSYNIIHRDLKPSNIMLVEMHGETDFVKVLDFGIAKMMHDGGDDDDDHVEQLTSAGVLVGTLKYMAPEQISGADLGPYTDLYALGLIALEMLSGESVYSGSGRWEVLRQQVSDEPVDIPETVLGSPIGQVLARCLDKDHTKRFRTAQEVIEALNAIDDARLETEPLFVDDGAGGLVARGQAGAQSEPSDVDEFESLKTVVVEDAIDGNKTEVTPQPFRGEGNPDAGAAMGQQAVSSPGSQAGAPAAGGHDAQQAGFDQGGFEATPPPGGADPSGQHPNQQHSPGGFEATPPPGEAADSSQQDISVDGGTLGDTKDVEEPSDLYPELRANDLRKGTVVQENKKSKGKSKLLPMAVAFVVVVGVGAVGGWMLLAPDDGDADPASASAQAGDEDPEPTEQDRDEADEEALAAASDEDDEADDEDEEPADVHSVTIKLEDDNMRARVFVDDDLRGRTPHTVEFEQENVLVRLEARDHEPLEVELDGESAEEIALELEKSEPEEIADRGQAEGDDAEEEVGGSAPDRGQAEPDPSPDPPPRQPDPEPEPEPEPEPASDPSGDWVDISSSDDDEEEEEKEERDVPLF